MLIITPQQLNALPLISLRWINKVFEQLK